ncbi:hypothetical protein [Leeia oryzae]|uniref:hypothetical protein n=1 Tax=Leeia oryzae TaxID=356662 RepID=UPI000361B9EB|nr:hypothetical protein [Leeia oryzae]
MSGSARSTIWFRLAVIYFAVAVTLGVGMGASGDHHLMPVHAHLNLLGWVSMTLFGLITHRFPAVGEGKLALFHFWVYNLSVPVMMVALTLRMNGMVAIEPLLGLTSGITWLAVMAFVIQVLTKAKS